MVSGLQYLLMYGASDLLAAFDLNVHHLIQIGISTLGNILTQYQQKIEV